MEVTADVLRQSRTNGFVHSTDVFDGMQLTVYGPLRSATGEKTVQVQSDGDTVRDVLDAFVTAYPRAEAHLTDDGGALRPSVRVVVDGERVDLDDVVAGESIQLFPAMRGG